MFAPWPQLASGDHDALIEAAAEVGDALDPASITRLHGMAPAQVVHGALELARARRKAAEKFDDPARLIADAVGVEQSSSIDVARHKARRFAALESSRIVDLCCGIGGDAMALAEVAPVLAVDLQPHRAWMARHNARLHGPCEAAVADVTTLALGDAPFHIDPDRRPGGRRRWRYEDYVPGPRFIGPLVERGGDGAIKLSPGVDLDSLPSDGRTELEIINRRGTLVQAVLWTGRLATRSGGSRTATLIDAGGRVHGFTADPAEPPVCEEPGAFVFAVDPAIERAELIGPLCAALGLEAVHPALGLLTANAPSASPWLTPFELLERMPWRIAKVREWLAAHGGGLVEVKTRGKAVDPNAAAEQLRGAGDVTHTVFALRFGHKIEAWITRRSD